jgi:hypothetical protein
MECPLRRNTLTAIPDNEEVRRCSSCGALGLTAAQRAAEALGGAAGIVKEAAAALVPGRMKKSRWQTICDVDPTPKPSWGPSNRGAAP